MGIKNSQLYTLSAHFKQRAKERFDIESDKCLKWFRQMSGKANEHKEQKCSNANRIAYVTKDGILFILDVMTYKAVTCFKVEKKKKNKKRDLKDILNSSEVNQTDVTQPTIETEFTPITDETEFIPIIESLPSASTGSVETFIEDVANFSSTSTDNADDGFYCLSDTQDADIPVSKEDKFIDINNNNYTTFEEEVLRLERRANLKNAKEFLQVIEKDVERFYKNYQLIKNGVLSEKNYGHLQELNQDIDVIANAFRMLKKLEQNYKILDKNKRSYEQEILQEILLESPKSNESDGFYTKH